MKGFTDPSLESPPGEELSRELSCTRNPLIRWTPKALPQQREDKGRKGGCAPGLMGSPSTFPEMPSRHGHRGEGETGPGRKERRKGWTEKPALVRADYVVIKFSSPCPFDVPTHWCNFHVPFKSSSDLNPQGWACRRKLLEIFRLLPIWESILVQEGMVATKQTCPKE